MQSQNNITYTKVNAKYFIFVQLQIIVQWPVVLSMWFHSEDLHMFQIWG